MKNKKRNSRNKRHNYYAYKHTLDIKDRSKIQRISEGGGSM